MFDDVIALTDAEIDARCAELESQDPDPPDDEPPDALGAEADGGDIAAAAEDAAKLQRLEPDARLLWLADTADLTKVSDYGVVEVIAACERVIAHALARQAEAIAALADRPCMQGSIGPSYSSLHQDRVTALELAARLNWSPGIAD